MRRVLVVDDDASIAMRPLVARLEDRFSVSVALSAEEARAKARVDPPDVVLLDMRLDPSRADDRSGLEVLSWMRKSVPAVPVIVLTGYGDTAIAVEAMKRGAVDFLSKADVDLRKLLATLEDHATAGYLQRTAQDGLMGEDAGLLRVRRLVLALGSKNLTVLILGESGTGKELVARALHRHSRQSAGPFVAVNLAAIPSTLIESELFGHRRGAFTGAQAARSGLFAQATGGTLFLDEIGEAPTEVQAKLLRVLENREYYPLGSSRPERADCRVIAASNRDLEVNRGFRRDLYFRLAETTVHVPPLRERGRDIVLLATHFLATSSALTAAMNLSCEAEAALLAYPWPGNVRELRNAIQQAAVAAEIEECHTIDVRFLPKSVQGGSGIPVETAVTFPTDLASATRAFQEGLIRAALRESGGHRANAARLLGLSGPGQLWRLIKRLGAASACGANDDSDHGSESL
jgi:two-component system NtrC family response regulator